MSIPRVTRDMALEHIRHQVRLHPPRSQAMHVAEALGLVAARDHFAAHACPPGATSTMDGFALDSAATRKASEGIPAMLAIAGEIRPGPAAPPALVAGQAARILTGGRLPEGADCVIAFEDAQVADNRLSIRSPQRACSHVRRAGDEVEAGLRLLRKGEEFSPAAVAALAVAGSMQVEAFMPPRALVLALGSELTAPDAEPEPGRMPADNLLLADGQLRLGGAGHVDAEVCPDDPGRMAKRLAATGDCQCVLTTGGTGPGQRDFVLQAAEAAGFTPLFQGVALTPGKSFFAAARGGTLLFALPGTPWAVYALLHALVLPALCWLRGRNVPVPTPLLARPLARAEAPQAGWERLVPCVLSIHGAELQATPLLDRARCTRQDMVEAQGLLLVNAENADDDLLPLIPISMNRRGLKIG